MSSRSQAGSWTFKCQQPCFVIAPQAWGNPIWKLRTFIIVIAYIRCFYERMVPNTETLCCQSILFFLDFTKSFQDYHCIFWISKQFKTSCQQRCKNTGSGKRILFTDKNHKRFKEKKWNSGQLTPGVLLFCTQRWRVLWFPDKQNSWPVRCVI